jgi:hypothetical protein
MHEQKTINKLWKALIFISILIATLTFFYPHPERPIEINLLIFVLTSLAFILLWFLLGVLAFSKVGPILLKSLPKSYIRENYKYLFFLKYFTDKEAFREFEKIKNEANI